jgi:DNA-binding CsgD family transcriptional regulator
VGRQAELARVAELLARASSGRAGALLVVGEAGIGKTRLLAEAVRRGEETGFRVASVACLPFVAPLPYEPVRALLRALGRRPAATLPPEALFARSLEALEQAAAESPLLLCLDDLHDSDQATLELVHYGIVRLADLPVAWLLAARPAGALTPFLHHLDRLDLLERLELGPLDEAELGELAARVLDGRPATAELVGALARRSGGNPFLFLELVRAAASGDGSGATAVPAGVRDAVTDRRRRLAPLAARLLDWLAVLPEPVAVHELAQVEPVPTEAVERALAALVLERLAEPADGGFKLVHALVREAVYETLPAGERRRMHSAAADALAEAPAERRAPQLAAAGRAGEAATAFLELGEAALARSGGEDAAALFRRAAELAAAVHDDRLRRRGQAGEVLALLRQGAGDQARTLAERLRAELRATGEAQELLAFLSRYALALYDEASDLEGALRALAEAGPLSEQTEGALLAEAETAQAFVLTMAGEPTRALPHAERAAAVAHAVGQPLLELRALNRLGLAVGMARDSAEATALLEQVAVRAVAAGLPAEAGLAYLNLSFFADAAGDARADADYARRGLALEHLPASLEVLLRSNLGVALADLGDLDGALAHQLAARAAAVRLEPKLEARVLVSLAHVHLLRGELEAARACLAVLDPLPGTFQHYRTLEQRGLLAELEGDLEQALALYLEGGDAGDHPSALWCLAGAARTAASLGQPAVAGEAVRRLERLPVRWRGTDWLRDEARGFLAAAEGRPADAAAVLAAAAEACPASFHAARLRLEAARLRGDRQGVLAAIEAFEGMQARGAADRARALARQLGLRPGRRRRRAGVLSERELEVALLVASGKTNAEIGAQLYLSPRTVERHVGAILAKLGHRSRVELAARVAAGELPRGPTG